MMHVKRMEVAEGKRVEGKVEGRGVGWDLGSQARSRVVTLLRDEKTVQVFARGLVGGGGGG